MPIYNWVGLGLGLASRKWSWAEAAAEMFTGSFNVTIGSGLEAYYGAHMEHAFGSHTELNVAGNFGSLGGFLTSYLMEASPLTLFGVGGHSEWNLGSKTEVVYGGPLVEILRGPKITKTGYTPLTWSGIYSELSPELQGSLPEDVTGAEVAIDDETTVTTIAVLSTLLAVSTAAFELAIRFAYPDYTPTGSSNDDVDPFSTPSILDDIVSQLSETIMGVIYLIELAGTYTPLATQCKDTATKAYEKGTMFLGYLAVPYLKIAECYNRASTETQDVILVVAISIALLVIAAIVVAFTLAVS
ncbi:MAG: hypothetical protein AB7K24_17565 [Gemmataceae bacterium]